MGVGWVFLDDSVVDLDVDIVDIACIGVDDGDVVVVGNKVVGVTCVDLSIDKCRYISYNAIKF